jgi:hypothetical protein
MNCPYCGKEMEKGIIASQEPLNWLKEERMINRPKEADGEFNIAKAGMSKRAVVDAWVCKDCRKIEISY